MPGGKGIVWNGSGVSSLAKLCDKSLQLNRSDEILKTPRPMPRKARVVQPLAQPTGRKMRPWAQGACRKDPFTRRNRDSKLRKPRLPLVKLRARDAPTVPVGSVRETEIEHVARHKELTTNKVCFRCEYIKRRSTWGLVCRMRDQRTWLDERPSYLGGSWSLGCRICAWART